MLYPAMVVSHPFRDDTAEWMGHPDFWDTAIMEPLYP
jgi:hypothetical protein